MLTFTRRVNQSFVIRDLETNRTMMIYVSECRGGQVRLSFDAPERIQILRTELLKDVPKIQHSPRKAAKA